MLEKKQKDVRIELDGGITIENAGTCLDAGAYLFVAGSSVFRGELTKNIEVLKKIK